ncbi:Protein SCAR2 [Senna tora]|uniref:Protein SCAR n=1 Tax=Senna tora TaxID=362788 RepID=A0A834WLP8_9FABA|nr:Protein SCAR2 [Senna tora]
MWKLKLEITELEGMPIARYKIRNELYLADQALYRGADKDDPEALLEGIAMAGLVGLLRQLGDLAEFAAEIFHNLHEEVMVTATRGHGLMARVQQLETEVPSIERAFLSQTHHLSFFSNGGIDWHPNLRPEHNLISRGDLPRFIMDSYEECRGPPRLFLLDKFDVAGAGACLKRYTDPSFFKTESASSGLGTVEVHREKKNRKIKKKGARLRNSEMPKVAPTHTKLHQLLLEERIENACSDPTRLVKLKKRQLNGSAVEAKTEKSYMENFLDSPSPDHKVVCETSTSQHPVRLASDDTSEAGIRILEISSIRPVERLLCYNKRTGSCISEKVPELKPSSEMCRKTNGDLVKVQEKLSAGVTDGISSNHHKIPDETELAVDEQKKTERILDGYHSDDLISEVDNYLDALATMESELEADYECRPKDSFLNIQKLTDSDDKEYQLQARFSYSQSFGDSSTSDEISSFKGDINEEHAEVHAQLSDSQSGSSFTSDENRSFKIGRNGEPTKLHAQFSDFHYVGNSTSDVNSSLKKDISCFFYSDSVVENMQSEPILLRSTKYNESEIEDTTSKQLPQIAETRKTDCSEFLMHDGIPVRKEVSGTGLVSPGSYLMNSGHKWLYSDLEATSSVKLPAGTQSEETPSGRAELKLRLANRDAKYHVESIDVVPDAISLMKVDAIPAVSSDKYPLNNLNDGDQSFSYDGILQISNDLELASEDECSNHSETEVLQAESPYENSSEILVSRQIGEEDHPICSSVEVDLNSGTKLLLDVLVSKDVDGTIATQLNSEDLSPMVETSLVRSFTGEHCSDFIHNSPQDEPNSAVIEVKFYDQQSNFEENSDEISGSTCSVNADEYDSHLKDSSSVDYIGQDIANNDGSIATCRASGMISSASRNLSSPMRRNLTNLEESCSTFADPNEKQTEINEAVSGVMLTELETENLVHQPNVGFLLRDVENSSSEKLKSEQRQVSNQLEEENAASKSAPEIHLDQPSSSEFLSQSAKQEVNHTAHVMNESLPLIPHSFPKASEINLEEMPPMPPLPPMQWRTGKVQHASLASLGEVIEVSQASFQLMQLINSNQKAQYGSLNSERETLQSQNSFLPVMAVEGDKLQHTSGFSVGGHPVGVPLQLPSILNEANGQYNYLVLERSQIQNSFLTLPVAMVSNGKPPHDYIVASEGEMVQNSSRSPPVPPVEPTISGQDPNSPHELCQPPSQLMTQPNLEVKTLQQSSSNLEGEQGDPPISPASPPSMENVQPNHNGEMTSTMHTSLASDFELEKIDGKPKDKLPRPRSPLIEAVAAHDKSKLRKVAERVRPQIAPKEEERDSLLEQIRTKSFNLKPAAPTRPRYYYQGPKTNLKIAAILEKANAIRQVLAGSDEDDDVDSWSDS